jgi:hypothetical protein
VIIAKFANTVNQYVTGQGNHRRHGQSAGAAA